MFLMSKTVFWSPVLLKLDRGLYKLLLAGSRLYVDGIINGNAEICLFGRHPIKGAEDNPGKLHGKGYKVMELTLSRLTSVLQVALVSIQ